MKRLLSFILAVTMIFSLFVAPVAAEGEAKTITFEPAPTVTLSAVSFTNVNQYVQTKDTIKKVKPGQPFAIKLAFTNNAEKVLNWSGGQFFITYDADAFEPYSFDYEDTTTFETGSVRLFALPYPLETNKKSLVNWGWKTNADAPGLMQIAAGVTDEQIAVEKGQKMSVMYFLFTPKEGVENGDYTFSFGTGSDGQLNALKAAETLGETDATVAGIDFSKISAQITVRDKDLTGLTLNPPDALAGDEGIEVPTVETEYIFTVDATFDDGSKTENYADATWNLDGTYEGITLENGKLTIKPSAGSYTGDTTFTVTAKEGDIFDSKTITLKRKDNLPKTVKIYRDGTEITGSDTLTIPSSGYNTYTYNAVPYDKYGVVTPDLIPGMTFNANGTGAEFDAETKTVTVPWTAKDGEATLTASVGGGDIYETVTLNIAQKPEHALSDFSEDKKEYTYGETINNPLTVVHEDETDTVPIVYSSSNEEYVEVNEVSGVLTLKKATPKDEPVIITATVAADETHRETTRSYTVTVAKAQLTITGLTAVDREYEAGNTTVALKGGELSGLVNGDTCDITIPTTGAIDSADAGTYTVRVETPELVGDASEKYVLEEISGITVNILAKTITPTVTLDGWTYGEDHNQAPTVTNNPSDGAVTYEYKPANGEYSTTRPTAAGTYTVRATIEASGNYAKATCENTFTISKKELTVTIGTITKQYDGTTTATLNTPTLIGAIEGDDVGVVAPWAAEFDSPYVGTHNITFTGNFELSGDAAGNYTLTQPEGITGTITAATRTLTSLATSDKPATLIKGGKTLDLTTLVTTNTPDKTGITFACETLDDCTLENGILTSGETYGQTLAITVKGAAVDLNNDGNPEYTAADDTTIYVQIVDKQDAGLTVDGITETMTYGDVKSLTWSVADAAKGGEITFKSSANDVILADGSKISAVGVGEATITATYDSPEYFGQKTFTVTVNKKPITVTADNQTMVYGGDLPELTYTVPENGLVAGDKLDIGAETDATSASNVGDYTITLTAAENANPNYAVTTIPGKLTITKAPLTIKSATVKSKQYDGTKDAVVTEVEFNGLKNGDVLVKDTDYTAEGRFTNVNAGQRDVVVTVTLSTTGTAANYELKPNTFTATAEITKRVTELTLSANNAVYTGKPYDLSNIKVGSTAATFKFFTYVDGVAVDEITRPTDAGTYWVIATVEESQNEEKSEKNAKFMIMPQELSADMVEAIPNQSYTGEQITPAVTIKYNGMTLTAGTDYEVSYGENITVGANAGAVTINGKGNYTGELTKNFTITAKPVTGAEVTFSGETLTYNGAAQHPAAITVKVGNVTLTAADYTVSYPAEANAGEHTATINFTGNYSGSVTAKYTIEKLTAQIAWSPAAANFLYTGSACEVTASVSNKALDTDEVNVTVKGGKQTEIGSYTATATALDNPNYQLPASGLTCSITIKNAIESIRVEGRNTVTATVDGLTIKLTGTMKEDESLALTINGATYNVTSADVVNVSVGDNAPITYKLDKTGLTKTPANVDLTETAPAVDTASTADEATVNAAKEISAQAKGLAAAAAEAVTKEAASKADGDATITAETKLEIQVVRYEKQTADNKSVLTLEITPKVTYKDAEKAEIETKEIPNSAIKAPVTISIKLPTGMPTDHLFVKHELKNGGVEYLKVTVDADGVATWQQSSFSPVVLMADNRSVTIKLVMDDESEIDMKLDLSSIGTALPKDGSKSKWKFDGITGSYDTITKELFDELAKKGSTVTATSVSGSSSNPDPKPTKPGTSSSGLLLPSLGDDELSFRDVSKYDYYYNAVKWAVKKGVTSGTGRYTFSPDDACTRAQTVTFLWRAAGCPKASTKANPFTDVAASDYFYEAVLWAVENGITNGTSKTTFSPNASVTRAQVATFLWRANGEPAARDSGFADVAANAYYAKAVAWAYAEGITTGIGFGVFSPEAICTRAQIVTFLFRNAK